MLFDFFNLPLKNNKKPKMDKIIINGKEINCQSGSKIIVNGQYIEINGKKEKMPKEKDIKIEIHGNVGDLKVSAGDVNVSGNVNSKLDVSAGDVRISGGVEGNISTQCGDIKVTGNVSGNALSKCGDVFIGE